jgi:hypothetical protein
MRQSNHGLSILGEVENGSKEIKKNIKKEKVETQVKVIYGVDGVARAF